MSHKVTVKYKAWCLKTLSTDLLLIIFIFGGVFLTPELHGGFKMQCFVYQTIYVKHT